MSSWADRLKQAKAAVAPQDQSCECKPTSAKEPTKKKTKLSAEENKEKGAKNNSLESSSEPILTEKRTTNDNIGEKCADDLNGRPQTSSVMFGPVALPANWANFISEQLRFGEGSTMPSSSFSTTTPKATTTPMTTKTPLEGASPPTITTTTTAAESGPSETAKEELKYDHNTTTTNNNDNPTSTILAVPEDSTNFARTNAFRRAPRRAYQRGRSANQFNGNRYVGMKNPYYMNNAFGEAFLKYNLHQQNNTNNNNNNIPSFLNGMEPSSTLAFHFASAGPHLPYVSKPYSQVHAPFFDSNALAYRPSYLHNSGLYYSGKLQPWPPYYPPE